MTKRPQAEADIAETEAAEAASVDDAAETEEPSAGSGSDAARGR